MPRAPIARLVLISFAPVLLGVTGCGPGKGVPLAGKVILPAGITLEKDEILEVTFTPDDPNVQRSARANVSGTEKATEVPFTANSAEIKGVLPCKYKVGVRITPYSGKPGSEARRLKLDETFNRKYDSAKTTLTYEVTDGPQNITIDLAKGTVTKD